MKKQRKRYTVWLVIALSLALLFPTLTACADDIGNTEIPEAEAEAPEPTPTPEPTPSPVPAQDPEPAPAQEATEEPAPQGEPTAKPGSESGTDEPEGSPSDEPLGEDQEGTKPVMQITAIACAGPAGTRMSYRPALEVVLNSLPGSAKATLSDGVETSEEELALTWSCADYGAEKTEYVFTAAQKASDYPLAEGVSMPVYTLTIADEVSGDFTYRLDADDILTITGWNGTDRELVVPEKLDGIPVVQIAAEAFRGKPELVKLALPKGVKSIGEKAFADCPALESLSLPDSLEADVPADAIGNDGALKELIISTDLDSRLSAADTVERDVPGEKEGEARTLRVRLPREATDIQVNASTFTLACDYRLDSEHGIGIAGKAELRVGSGRTLTLSGQVQNHGTLSNAGTIIDCGGAISGNAPRNEGDGKVSSDHAWQDGKCQVCGAAQPEPTPSPTPEATNTPEPTATPETTVPPEIVTLKVRYTGSVLTKVYDRTTGTSAIANKPQKKDFSLSGADPEHDVKIDKVTLAAFDSSDAGERRISVKVTLTGADKGLYKVEESTIPGVITPRPLIIKAPSITPGGKNPLTKTFGASDPKALPGVVKKGCLLSGDEGLLTGALAREPGEAAGHYKMLPGSVSAGKNYEVQMEDYYFTIAPKSINSTDVGLVSLKPQRYTGKPVKPAVTLRVGTAELVEGKDFTVAFSDNINVGSAKAVLKGIGNYAGQRETTFRILNTSGGSGSSGSGRGPSGGRSGSSGGSGGSSAGSGGPSGDTDPAEADEESAEDACRLLLDGRDFEEILFDGYDVPQSFDTLVEDNENKEHILTITARPQVDPETKEELPFLEDGARLDYGELHLRIAPDLAVELRQDDYAEIIYQMEDARLSLPLDALTGEITLEPDADDAETETEPEVLRVKAYDIWIEQVQMMLLSESESLALETCDPLTPVYRLWIRAIPVPGEDDAAEANGGDGLEYGGGEVALVALPAYPESAKLCVGLSDDLRGALEAARTLSVPAQGDPESDAEFEVLPAAFIEIEDALYADIAPTADGLYAVVAEKAADPDE